jgi:hypothetical protein
MSKKKMSGWERQEVGDWGEDTVKALLSRNNITSAPLEPDLGEDFLIEVRGREASATGNHPLMALLQVKARVEECFAEKIKVPKIKKTKLMRWSSQQLPVFIIAVSGYSAEQPQYFIRAVDDFLEQNYSGKEIRDMPTKTVSVDADRTEDLVSSLTEAIHKFHQTVDINLENLSESEKRNQHFEVIQRASPGVIGRLARTVPWSIIWRASRRPAYFSAMMRELFREAHDSYYGLPVPVYVSFHVYRSQHDKNHNMAVARVHWLDDLHPKYEQAAAALKYVGPEIEYLETPPEVRTIVDTKVSAVPAFVTAVKAIAPKIDEFAKSLLDAEKSVDGGKYFWTDISLAKFDRLERSWEQTSLAPTELFVIQQVLDDYVHVLEGHKVFAGMDLNNPSGEKERYRLEAAEEIEHYYGAWRVLLKHFQPED